MWPQHMQSDSVTQVCVYHGMRDFQGLEYVREFMSVLQQECATHSCALSISIQQSRDGAIEITAHTLLLKDMVSAIAAKLKQRYPDYIVAVETVLPRALGNTSVVMRQLRNLRVNHGH